MFGFDLIFFVVLVNQDEICMLLRPRLHSRRLSMSSRLEMLIPANAKQEAARMEAALHQGKLSNELGFVFEWSILTTQTISSRSAMMKITRFFRFQGGHRGEHVLRGQDRDGARHQGRG